MISSIAKHLVIQCAFASIVLAGTAPDPKAPADIAPVPPADDPWEVTLSLPVWMSGVKGTTGVHGYTAYTDVSFSSILENLDMTAAANFEVRKGRWGGWVDGIYLKASVGADTPGPLLNSLDVGIEQVTAEAAVFYRAWKGARGYLDVYAGARYMWMSGELGFNVSNSGVQQVSQQLSQQVVDQVVSAVKTEADAALASARSKIVSKVTTAARAKVSAIVAEKATAVSAKVTEAKTALANLQQIAAAYPRLTEVLRNSPRLKSAIQSVAQARVDEKLAEAQQTAATASAVAASASAAAAAAQAAVQAAADKAKASAKKAVSKAEKKLAGEIEEALRDAIPSQISQSLSWVDPFVGLRARYNLTDRLYAIAKADIGGFGVSSDLVWQAYGALGYNLTKSGKTTAELGYKYMAVDYTRGGFTYDVALSGVMLNLGLKF